MWFGRASLPACEEPDLEPPGTAAKSIPRAASTAYVYRRDASVGRDASIVARTKDFDLPLRRAAGRRLCHPRRGAHVYACMTSDFFLPEADAWRAEAWECIRARPDVSFSIITKRILRAGGMLAAGLGRGL